jgi:hypothetical protein
MDCEGIKALHACILAAKDRLGSLDTKKKVRKGLWRDHWGVAYNPGMFRSTQHNGSHSLPQIPLSKRDIAHVLAGSVHRLMRLGVEEPVAISAVARDNRVTGECVRAAMCVASQEVIA